MGALAGEEVAAGVGAVLVEGRGVCFEGGFGVFVGVAMVRWLGDVSRREHRISFIEGDVGKGKVKT